MGMIPTCTYRRRSKKPASLPISIALRMPWASQPVMVGMMAATTIRILARFRLNR
jgi:hypothetical protein